MASENYSSTMKKEEMATPFAHLPLEMRLVIGTQFSNYSDYSNFRLMDSANLALLPFYGVRDGFRTTDNEFMFVTWVCRQMTPGYSDNGFLSSVMERYDADLRPLAVPLRYDGKTEDGFAEYRCFFERIRDVAFRRSPASTVRPLGVSIRQQTYDRACLQLDHMQRFLWHPDGFVLDETERQDLEEWSQAIKESFELASRFNHVPGDVFNFHRTVAGVLINSITELYEYFFGEDTNWDDEEVALDAAGDLVFWVQELFTFVMRTRAWDDIANGVEGKLTSTQYWPGFYIGRFVFTDAS